MGTQSTGNHTESKQRYIMMKESRKYTWNLFNIYLFIISKYKLYNTLFKFKILDFSHILKALASVDISLQQLREHQITIVHLLETSEVIKHGVGANELRFEDKYEFVLPLKSIEDFQSFEQKLSSDENCQKDFVSKPLFYIFINIHEFSLMYIMTQLLFVLQAAWLYFAFDKQKNVSKTITNILKKCMSRELALRFTAQKQCAGKIILKGTRFSKRILGKNNLHNIYLVYIYIPRNDLYFIFIKYYLQKYF